MIRSRVFYIVKNFFVVLIGISIVLSLFSFADVGDDDVISLQSSVSSITALAVYEPVEIPAVYNPNEEIKVSKLDDLNVEKNTYVITSKDIADEYEIIEPEAFTYDGLTMWVDVNLANIRENPNVEAEIVEQLEYATEVLRISYGNSWSLIRFKDGEEGYIISSSLTDEFIEPTESPTPTATATPTQQAVATSTPVPNNNNTSNNTAPGYTVSAYSATLYASCALNVRTGPGVNYSLVRVLSSGATLTITGQTNNGWYQLSDGNFVKSDLCVSTPPQQNNYQESSTGNSFSDYCLQFVGTVYIYGGSSPSGFDCSGFVRYVYANYYGISLPHNAAEIAQLGTPVSGDVQVGDVLCHDYNGDGYIEHCSIYIGNGQCIHASNSRSGVITSPWPMGAVVTIRRFI